MPFDIFGFCGFFFALLTPKSKEKEKLCLLGLDLYVILTSYGNLSSLNKYLDHSFFLRKRNAVFAGRQFVIRINIVFLGKRFNTLFKNRFKNLLFTLAIKCIFKINLLKTLATQKRLS